MQFSILFAVTALLAAAVSAAPAENAQAAEAAANRCGSFCFQKGHKCSGGMHLKETHKNRCYKCCS